MYLVPYVGLLHYFLDTLPLLGVFLPQGCNPQVGVLVEGGLGGGYVGVDINLAVLCETVYLSAICFKKSYLVFYLYVFVIEDDIVRHIVILIGKTGISQLLKELVCILVAAKIA